MRPSFLPATLSLFTACQTFAAECAERDMPFPADIDTVMGKLENMLATTSIESTEDLLAKVRFLGTYRRDPASIPAVALDTLVAGGERMLVPAGVAIAA